MTDAKLADVAAVPKATLLGDPDFLEEIVRAMLREVLEVEMTDPVLADSCACCDMRTGCNRRRILPRLRAGRGPCWGSSWTRPDSSFSAAR